MGGGFCEQHGPFDPPHRVCPYCAMEDNQRAAYGPPTPSKDNAMPEDDFVRETIEPDESPPTDVTEIVRRPDDQPVDGYDGPTPLCWLVVKEPADRRGEMLRVRPNEVIGREGDAIWNDPRLSRQHARLTFEPLHTAESEPRPYGFYLWPFAPTNPVIINGREIRAATPLHENDEIRLGDTLFVLKVLTD